MKQIIVILLVFLVVFLPSASAEDAIFGDKPYLTSDPGEITPPSYGFILKWGSVGTGNGQFIRPVAVAVSPSGSIYVADQHNHRIQVFTTSGGFFKWGGDGPGGGSWPGWGTGNGEFNGISDIAVDRDGFIYVVDANNHRIQKFTSGGAFVTKWGKESIAGNPEPGDGNGEFTYPNGIAIAPDGTIYVTELFNFRVQAFTKEGIFIRKWGASGEGDGQFKSPSGIAVDASGNVYVADANNNRIQKFTSGGEHLASWGEEGKENGQFKTPQGVTVNDEGILFVADTGNHRIQLFDSNGTFLAKWGRSGFIQYGSGDGEFNWPQRVTVDANGRAYISDTLNDRIQLFGSRPFITKIEYSPAIPITDTITTFNAVVKEVPGYTITGLEWNFMVDNLNLSSLDERLGGRTNLTNPQRKIWNSGKYGEKRLIVKLFGNQTPAMQDGAAGIMDETYSVSHPFLTAAGETEPSLLDQKEIIFHVFFPMGGPANWKTNTSASPLNWAKDPTIAVNEPNWYHYWKREGAITNIDTTIYDSNISGAGYFNPSTNTVALGKAAPRLWRTITLNTGLKPGGETIGGTVGITGATATVFHELHHQTIHNERTSGSFAGLIDSDYNTSSSTYYYKVGNLWYYRPSNDKLPDAFENGTLTTQWEPRGSLTDINNTDTYNFSTLFSPSYKTYGDNEYLCYREENRAIGRVEGIPPRYDYTKDWSDGGMMAENQAKEQTLNHTGISSLQTIQSEQLRISDADLLVQITTDTSGYELISYHDYGEDTDGNNLFNTLNIDLVFSVDHPGFHSLAGYLTADDGTIVAATDHRYDLSENGTYQATLIFEGTIIHLSGKNGPYTLSVTLTDSGGREDFVLDEQIDAHTTESYTLSQFEGSQISFSDSYDDSGIDADGDGIIDLLKIDVGMDVIQSGIYSLSAELYKETDYLTTTFTQSGCEPGSQTVSLVYGGRVIGIKGIDGPYELRNLAVRDEQNVLMDFIAAPYTTNFYSADTFVPSPPEPAFSATPTSGTAPLIVRFSDESTGNPETFRWEYSNGSGWREFSGSKNPSYTFTEPATYSIGLTVTNDGGSVTHREADYIRVTTPQTPGANFTADCRSGPAPRIVHFTDTSTGVATAWLWDFGDGSPSVTTQHPVHTYTVPGTYTVNLTAANAGGTSMREEREYIIVHIHGDFNGNRQIDIGDVAKVAWMAIGLLVPDMAADFNGDGRVDGADASHIAYYYVGKIPDLVADQ
jgi:PKD repeat protein